MEFIIEWEMSTRRGAESADDHQDASVRFYAQRTLQERLARKATRQPAWVPLCAPLAARLTHTPDHGCSLARRMSHTRPGTHTHPAQVACSNWFPNYSGVARSREWNLGHVRGAAVYSNKRDISACAIVSRLNGEEHFFLH